jgi:hypothetical protein
MDEGATETENIKLIFQQLLLQEQHRLSDPAEALGDPRPKGLRRG